MKIFSIIALITIMLSLWFVAPRVLSIVSGIDFIIRDAYYDEMQVRPLEGVQKIESLFMTYFWTAVLSLPFVFPLLALLNGLLSAISNISERYFDLGWVAIISIIISGIYFLVCLLLIFVFPEHSGLLIPVAASLAMCAILISHQKHKMPNKSHHATTGSGGVCDDLI